MIDAYQFFARDTKPAAPVVREPARGDDASRDWLSAFAPALPAEWTASRAKA